MDKINDKTESMVQVYNFVKKIIGDAIAYGVYKITTMDEYKIFTDMENTTKSISFLYEFFTKKILIAMYTHVVNDPLYATIVGKSELESYKSLKFETWLDNKSGFTNVIKKILEKKINLIEYLINELHNYQYAVLSIADKVELNVVLDEIQEDVTFDNYNVIDWSYKELLTKIHEIVVKNLNAITSDYTYQYTNIDINATETYINDSLKSMKTRIDKSKKSFFGSVKGYLGFE
jgi:hypothetical protein